MRGMLYFLLATNTSRPSRRFGQLMSHELQPRQCCFLKSLSSTIHSAAAVQSADQARSGADFYAVCLTVPRSLPCKIVLCLRC